MSTLKPTLADLRAFVTVGELQSFAAAARALHLSQPALSRRISHLEHLLDVRLFDRTTRSVELTPLGQRFLAQVRNVITDLDRSVVDLHDVAHLEAGDVTIGCVFSAVHHFLPAVIRTYRERHPHVLVRIIEEGADEVLQSVKSGEADFALNYTGMQDPEVSFTPLLREPFVLACPVGHPLARRRSVRWAEIGDHPYALVSHASRNRVLIDQALAELAPLPRPVCEFRHISTLIGFVENGLGVAIVPQLTLPRPPASVVGVRLEHPAIHRTIGLTQRTGRTLSPAAAAFAQLITQASQATARPARRGRA
ncbi:MAG: LysR family transcriptional regulator [Hydrogenophaga sp.]|jgi:DNA-binding transcriptional LysR family regulator|uniref:LysR family transcriptional regulator n=1 Tax=Hydrogenophaga sp. TaxID=1904254 RepID=UPI001D48EEC2|nr:LysR family transcriptional regulator [Hydrogenophaga sp.]MBW0172351.1 LysR family transcriptional regulator [Hydrogenophaga sp.]MBW0182722.1 LysR family transcriptional regulator [Hydrogenophaga sp.]